MKVQNVKTLRLKKFLTQTELGKESNVSTPVILRMEKGHDVAISSVRAVARALGVEPEELVEEPVAPQEES